MLIAKKSRIAAAGAAALIGIALASSPSATALESHSEKHPSELYLKLCASCHGADGKAATEDGKKLKAEVFANASWQAKKKAKADKLINSVLNGHGKKMPAFKDKISAEDAKRLVEKDVLGPWK